jgi:hypothetical protein
MKKNNAYKVVSLDNGDESARFTPEGMVGARKKNPDRPVSLMSWQARQEVDQAVRRGLCYRRFRADITIDCVQMPAKGAIIQAGELALEILPEGKTCWPECELYQEGLTCPLQDGVRYAKVETTGALSVGEVFTVVE